MRNIVSVFCMVILLSPLSAADYYWIGGTGSWSNILNWATTSGGVVTHNTAPTADDNVIFDANSFTAPNQQVLLDGDLAFCRDMRWEPGTQGAKFTAAPSATLNVFGGMQLSTDMVFDFQGNVRFVGDNTGNILDLAGQTFLRDVTFQSLGGDWALQSDLAVIGVLYFYDGQLVSNGHQLFCERFYASAYTPGSLLDLTGSTVTITGIDEANVRDAYTLNIQGGSSSFFALSAAQFILNGSEVTYRSNIYDSNPVRVGAISMVSETGNTRIETGTGQPAQLGKLVIQNNAHISPSLQVDSLILGGGKQFQLGAGIQLDLNFLSVEGNCQEPVLLQSDQAGVQAYFRSDTNTISADFVSMQDIHALGTANFIANDAVDMGNTDGWTFNTKSYSELYWVGGTGMWDDPAHWSFTSGGPGGACIPTPGEDVIFDANSFASPLDIVLINVENVYCRDMRWEAPVGMPTLSGTLSQNLRIFGSLTLSPAMNFDFAGDVYFQALAEGQTITTSNQIFQKDVLFKGTGGWALQDSFKVLQDFYFESGYLNTNDQYLSMSRFYSETSSTRLLELTSSTLTLQDTIRYFYGNFNVQTNNLTLDAGTSTLAFISVGGIYAFGEQSLAFHKVVNYTYAGHDNFIDGLLHMDTLELYQESRLYHNYYDVSNLIINAGYNLRISSGDTLRFDSLLVRGGCGAYAEIRSGTVGQAAVLLPTRPATVSDLIVQDIHNPAAFPITAYNSVDLENNLGWDFVEQSGRDLYWVGDGGEWADTSHWSLTSGGAGGECPPGPEDNVYFDGNSFSQPDQYVFTDSYTWCKDMDWTGAAFHPAFFYRHHQQYGDLTFIDSMSIGQSTISFRSNERDNLVTTRGQFFGTAIFEGNGSWQVVDTLQVYALEYLAGDLSTRGAVVVMERLGIYEKTPKVLDLRDAYWYFDGNNNDYNNWWVNWNSLDTVLATGSTVELRSEYPALHLNDVFTFDRLLASNTMGHTEISVGLDPAQPDSVTFRELDLRNSTTFEAGSMYGDTILLSAGKTYQLNPYGELRGDAYIQMIGNNCTPIELRSRISGLQADLVSPTGLVKADFVQMQDIRAVGDAPFYAGVHSTDISNNTNWIFDSAEEFVDEGFLGPDKVLCDASTITLDANNFSPGETYLWQDGSADATLEVAQPGVYYVQVTFANNCIIRDSVQVLSPVAFAAQLPDTLNLLCEGDTLLLDAGLDLVGLSYLWQDSSRQATFPVTAAGEYKVTLELNGCTSSDSTMVQLVAYPEVDLGPDLVLCADASFTLDATTDTATYRWLDDSRGTTFEVSAPGDYWVDVSYGQCTTRDSVLVTYYDPIPLDLGPDTTICAQSSLLIPGGLANASYTWSDGSTSNSLTVNAAGTYGVAALVNGCTAYDSVVVSIQELPRFDLGPDTAICAGESLLLDGTTLPGATYEWSDGSTDPALLVTTAGLYALQTRLNGCTFADTRNIEIAPLPVVDLGADRNLCEGETELLQVAQAGATYLWQDGSTENSLLVSGAGTYTVVLDLNGCTAEDSVRFAYKPLPRFELGPDTAICAGESLLLDGTTLPGATYAWSDGSTDPALLLTTAGLYVLEATLDGCTFADTRTLSIKPLPQADLGADRILCEGETALLSVAQSGATYLWQDGSTAAEFLAAQTGTYEVSVVLAGCTVADSVSLAFTPLPRFELGADTLLCVGESLLLDGFVDSNTSYSWQDGSTTAQLLVNAGGTYRLEATNNNCSFADDIRVSYAMIPDNLLGMDQVLCEGETLAFNLTVPNATTYQWMDGNSSPDYQITTAGTYGVQVLVERCVGGDTINVSYNPLPRFDLGPDTTLCEGEQLLLDIAILADSYQWQDGSTAADYPVTFPGIYAATATLDGCSYTDELLVDYQASRSFSLGPDTTICAQDPFQLRVDQPADRIEWQDGSLGGSFTVMESGTYSVQIQDGACVFVDTVQVDTRDCFAFQGYLPTAFSPNGDGVNDVFTIGLPPNITILAYELQVFDRWGSRVYYGQDISEGWDGYLQQAALPAGIYLYAIRIRFRDDYQESEEVISGDVLLIR